MALFQKTVEQKYLKQLNAELINAKYLEFKSHFGNTDIQENIRNSKEEQYQGEFLIDLFVKILGYVKNPTPNFNLTTEYKNVKDSKKADGAILLDKGACPIVIGVIELKGTNTTDLSKIETQAFGYKNNQAGCVYVVTSNFEKLRFYIDNAIEHIEFNLFTLSKADFEILYLCLSFESIKNGLPKKVKEESLSQEDVITKKLYQDYSLFKRELHQNLVSLNPQYDSLTLFKKSQKLLDRFLFLFFAEDRNLLPPNSVRLILNDWRDLQERDVEIPLYQRFKKYFEYLNTGYKGKRYDVFAYNGGLFKPDEVLDTIFIDDELLFKHTYNLSEYDFASEIDVNILGHIFENSLNELDEINAQLAGEEIDKTKTKRKKDGVFYTPKYITKYIVENTVGKLCAEKKAELQIVEEEYATDKRRQLKTKQALLNKLKTYQNWLLQLTICDPACGSGAFLNQALDFLITEHRYIDELQAKLLSVPIIFSDIEKSILENNLFGVDLNEESVEIAKLSLWLRTAQPNRKLNDLNNNIKCGNSLISDPAIAGNKAFDWEREFPQVFVAKHKKGWHITCATHNSRYSQRMFDYHIEVGDAVWLSEKEEIIIIETVAKIAKDDNLNIIACTICGDHLHLLLVCEEQEIPRILQKIKSISARECNIAMGRTIPILRTREHAPLSSTPDAPLSRDGENSPDYGTDAPLSRGTAQAHLWTQKFGCKEITSDEQLENTINYIRNNRKKHGLPEFGGSSGSSNNGACPIVNSTRSDVCSLVENMCCSPEHAFRPEYKGGFDVVIGNPPYVRPRESYEAEKFFYIKNYKTAVYQIDLYILFIERGISLMNINGFTSYIVPNAWLNNLFQIEARRFFLNNIGINEIVAMPSKTFEQANVDTVIISLSAINEYKHTTLLKFENSTFIEVGHVQQKTWLENESLLINITSDININNLLEKIIKDTTPLESFAYIGRGVGVYHKRVGHTKELIDADPYQSTYIKDETFVPYIRGKSVTAWNLRWNNDSYISYGNWLAEPREPKFFEGERIILRQIPSDRLIATYIDNDFIIDQSVFISKFHEDTNIKPKFVLALISSKLFSFYFRNLYSEFDELFPKLKLQHFKNLPIKVVLEENQQPFIEKADQMLSLNKELQETSQKFQRNIQREYNLEKLSTKLENWFQITFNEFLKELEKSKVKLTLSQKAEWEDYFLQESKKALAIKHQIDTTDQEIDRMVYELYGLTEDEIKLVAD